jgi:hypothetical protein
VIVTASGSSIECNKANCRRYSKKTGKIIENRFLDVDICTSLTATAGENIPDRDPMLCQL